MAALHTISKGRLRMQLQQAAGDAVAYYPAFRRVLGLNAAAAQFLSQAVYWAERTNDGWFYKTEAEWQGEIGLAPDEVRDARRNLKALGILDEQRKGIPAKMFFRINADVLMAALAGDVQEVTLEQVLTIHRTKLTQLSKTGLMRATKLGVTAEYVDYAAVLEKHGMVCGCCGKAIVRSPGKGGQHLSFDHIIPLAAGGTHVFANLQPAHASCNGAKGSKVLASATRTLSVEKSSSSTVVELEALQKKHKRSSAKATITETTQETTAETTSLALVSADAASKRRPKANGEAAQARQEACRAIWGSYAQAYVNRYGAAPVRNAKVNRQVVDLWKRLGAEAAAVAEYFVSINDSYLIRNCHDLGSLLTKAESYRTQWATGRQMNGRTARQLEDTQANINAAQEAAARIRARENGGVRNDNPFLR